MTYVTTIYLERISVVVIVVVSICKLLVDETCYSL